jgi:hypothetical protein
MNKLPHKEAMKDHLRSDASGNWHTQKYAGLLYQFGTQQT